jgi:hypothetical protein
MSVVPIFAGAGAIATGAFFLLAGEVPALIIGLALTEFSKSREKKKEFKEMIKTLKYLEPVFVYLRTTDEGCLPLDGSDDLYYDPNGVSIVLEGDEVVLYSECLGSPPSHWGCDHEPYTITRFTFYHNGDGLLISKEDANILEKKESLCPGADEYFATYDARRYFDPNTDSYYWNRGNALISGTCCKLGEKFNGRKCVSNDVKLQGRTRKQLAKLICKREYGPNYEAEFYPDNYGFQCMVNCDKINKGEEKQEAKDQVNETTNYLVNREDAESKRQRLDFFRKKLLGNS